jgi:hypothetical protein
MFLDRNAPTGLLGLGLSINEMELHQTAMQLIRAHASEDYFAQAALTLAREWSAANQEVGRLNDRLMQECQDGVMPESVFPQVHTFPSSLAAYILSKPAHYLTS